MDSEYSKYGFFTFKDGIEGGWHRIRSNVDDDFIKEKLKAGAYLFVGEIGTKFRPLGRQETNMFRDMTYAACRQRYEDSRSRILDRIARGKVSASMSGIDGCFYPWDETPPSLFESDLKTYITWNGVWHVETNWLDILNANHPLANPKKGKQ